MKIALLISFLLLNVSVTLFILFQKNSKLPQAKIQLTYINV